MITFIEYVLARVPPPIIATVGFVLAWKLQIIPSIWKGTKASWKWMTSLAWRIILEPKYRLAHSYYLKSLLTSPMQALGSSVKYRLLTPSVFRPEIRDPVFGCNISEAAVLFVVASSTVKSIHFQIECIVGTQRIQDAFRIRTNGRSCEFRVVRPAYPLDDYTLFTSNSFASSHVEIAARVQHENHVEHCFQRLTPTHQEFWRGEVACRDGRSYNITIFARAKEEVAEKLLEALLTAGEVTLSTNRANARDLPTLIRRGQSLRWDTPIRRLIATLLTSSPLLDLIFWIALFRNQINFDAPIPEPRLSWLTIFRLFRLDRVRPLVLRP